jgi:peptidoglycan/LPS O-acetylase OafA/YrhL
MTLTVADWGKITAEVGSYRLFGSYRAALALAVVVSHSQPMLGPNFVGSIELGNIAVMSFFVLSGFIISEAGSTFYRGRPLAFLANRFWRIAPIYWLALA